MNGDWYRLEPSNRAAVLEPGLGAPIADAAWMLARQWQVGEFRGEDAARPIRCRYEAERVPITHLFPDPDVLAADTARPLPDGPAPVEVYVEREQLTTGSAAFAFAAEAGVQLLRQLRVGGVSATTRRKIAASFAFGPADDLGPAATVLAARAPDGAAAYAARAGLHERSIIPPAERAATSAAVATWAAWYEGRCAEPPAAGDAALWRDERLGYRFALGTRVEGSSSTLVLSADDHAGGALEWHAFDLAARPRVALPPSTAVTERGEVFPAPVRYGGMPAPRWWTFEDAAVHFGGVSSGPADLARMVVAEFASVYANDWWMVPVPAVAGHLHRITSLVVVDSFGGTYPIPAAASDVWRFFHLTGDPSARAGTAPWLLILDTALGAAEGDAVETVELVRDEQANLGWAGECTYEAADGRTRRRMNEWRAADPDGADERSTDPDAWRFVFSGSGTPPLWAPLVPERPDPSDPAVVLRRARMRDWQQLPGDVARLRGRILTPDRPFAIDEVELPRSGLTITRSYQATRDRQGRLWTWAGRRRRPGRGERTIGSRHDRIVP